MRAWLRRVLSPGQRGVAVIAGGTLVGQLVAALVSPVLTRLYTPADFGALAAFTALVTLLGVVAAGRYELAIPLPEKDMDARAVVALGLSLCALVALVGAPLAGLVAAPLSSLLHTPSLRDWVWLIPVSAGLMGAYLVLNQWCIRVGAFAAIGRRNILQGLSTVAVQALTGVLGLRPGGLLAGLTVGYLSSAASLAHSSRVGHPSQRAAWDGALIRRVAREYRRFPQYLTFAGLLNVGGLQLPILLVAALYGEAVAGWLGLTQRILALPVTLVGTAIAQVYLSTLARAVRERVNIRPLYMRTSRRLGAMGLTGAVVLVAFGPQLFTAVFGSNWTTSGDFSRAMAFALAGQLVGSPLSQTLIVTGRQRLQLAWDAGRLVGACGAIYVTWVLSGTALTAVWMLGSVSAFFYVVAWWLGYRATRTT